MFGYAHICEIIDRDIIIKQEKNGDKTISALLGDDADSAIIFTLLKAPREKLNAEYNFMAYLGLQDGNNSSKLIDLDIYCRGKLIEY